MNPGTISFFSRGMLTLAVNRFGEGRYATIVPLDATVNEVNLAPLSIFIDDKVSPDIFDRYERACAAFNAVMTEAAAPAPRPNVDPMFTALCESDWDVAAYVAAASTTGA